MAVVSTRKGNGRHGTSAKNRMCDGKLGYDTMTAAEEVAERMQAEFPHNLYSVYPCLFCRFVHVGRRNPSEATNA